MTDEEEGYSYNRRFDNMAGDEYMLSFLFANRLQFPQTNKAEQ